MSPTDVIEAATTTSIPPITLQPITETFVPVTPSVSTSVPSIPTTVVLEDGLSWSECILPLRDYSHTKPDIELITNCLNMDFPRWDDSDKVNYGERVHGIIGDNLRLVVGNDIYETRYTRSTADDYELLKNGVVIARASAYFNTFDPNRNLGMIGGKVVWEIISEPPALIVDGRNVNDVYQLEGSFFPYEVNGKLIYIAKKNGQYHIVYNDKTIGPEFDEISMAYCCAKLSVSYGKGQYWFLGRRDGVQYIVAIH